MDYIIFCVEKEQKTLHRKMVKKWRKCEWCRGLNFANIKTPPIWAVVVIVVYSCHKNVMPYMQILPFLFDWYHLPPQ